MQFQLNYDGKFYPWKIMMKGFKTLLKIGFKNWVSPNLWRMNPKIFEAKAE
jgi:hypothetical protein